MLKKKEIVHLDQYLFHLGSFYLEKANILFYERCHYEYFSPGFKYGISFRDQ